MITLDTHCAAVNDCGTRSTGTSPFGETHFRFSQKSDRCSQPISRRTFEAVPLEQSVITVRAQPCPPSAHRPPTHFSRQGWWLTLFPQRPAHIKEPCLQCKYRLLISMFKMTLYSSILIISL